MNAEIERRHADTEKVLALVRSRDGQTLHWRRFFLIAPQAWRTRISNAREVLCREQGLPFPVPKHGIDPLAWNGSIRRSGYRYSSNALGGREAATFVPGNPDTGTLFDTHPGAYQR